MENKELSNNTQPSFKYIYGISFKGALQTYYFGSEDETLKVGDKVVVQE